MKQQNRKERVPVGDTPFSFLHAARGGSKPVRHASAAFPGRVIKVVGDELQLVAERVLQLVDCGDHVIIINAEKAVLTGKKLVQKVHYHHSGWIGGMKEIRYDKLMKENPEKAMMLAVKGMIPDTTIGRQALTRCRIYRGSEHNHAAQKPEQL